MLGRGKSRGRRDTRHRCRPPRPGAAAASSSAWRSRTSRRGVLTIATANMANAIREITVEQGQDPRRCALMAVRRRGAAVRHAARRASSTSAGSWCLRYAGNFSAWGLLGADLVRSAGSDADPAASTTPRSRRRTRCWPTCSPCSPSAGVRVRKATREVGLDMRYVGQEHFLTVADAERGRPHHGGRGRAARPVHRRVRPHVRPHHGRACRDRLRQGDGAHAAATEGGGAPGHGGWRRT